MPTLTDAREFARDLSQKALAIVEDPKLTVSEKATALEPLEADIKTALKEVQDLEGFEKIKADLKTLNGHQDPADVVDELMAKKSLGRQFVESAGFKGLSEGNRGGTWSTGPIELKTTIAEGTSQTGTGGALVATPTVLPGILDIKFRPLTINDLIPQGTTSSVLIRYLAEAAITNAAAVTVEGATKPESAISFSKVDERLRKIATFLPITDEMLEDWEQAMAYIDGRLRLFVQLVEEVELLLGDGTGEHLTGLMNRSGKATIVSMGDVADENQMDAIYRQITAIRTTSFLEPDGIVIDPASWETVILSKTTQGQYLAGGPFMDEANRTLWGKRVSVTTAMTAATALVGAFAQAAQVFRKGGLTVEASNSHADFFQKNLTALRAEERLALAVYRPGAFGIVDSLAG